MRRADLHAYQNRAVDFVLDRGKAALWLGLGLGKTAIALTAIADWLCALVAIKVLVVAPLRVAHSVWAQEAARWEHLRHLRFSKVLGTAAQRKAALAKDADVYLINRENIPWLVLQLGAKWPFDTVILDEASSFKGFRTRRFRALKAVSSRIERLVELTGTPASQGLTDLWSQVYLLDGGKALGRTMTAYRDRWFVSDYMGWEWTPRDGAEAEIHEALRPLALSLSSEDYLSLPERVDVRVDLDLGPDLRKTYEDFRRKSVLDLGDAEIEAASAGVLAGKLLQFADGAVYTGVGREWRHVHDLKLDALEELLDDYSGENMIVAYRYVSDLERLRRRFPKAVVLKDQASIDAWNSGEVGMLLAHPASAGHGLNLQSGGAVLVWFGLTWSREEYTQMIGRLHRQGQTLPVRVVHLVTTGTFDERVLEVLEAKGNVQAALLAAVQTELAA